MTLATVFKNAVSRFQQFLTQMWRLKKEVNFKKHLSLLLMLIC